MANTTKITFKQKEVPTFTFTIKDEDGEEIDVSADTFAFKIKEKRTDTAAEISKVDADFDTTQAASGIIKVTPTQTEMTLRAGTYKAELEITFASGNIKRSQTIDFEILQSIMG